MRTKTDSLAHEAQMLDVDEEQKADRIHNSVARIRKLLENEPPRREQIPQPIPPLEVRIVTKAQALESTLFDSFADVDFDAISDFSDNDDDDGNSNDDDSRPGQG